MANAKIESPLPLILKDTKEKEGHGWRWIKSRTFRGMESRGLKTGDYTIEGLEDVLAIERKGSIAEWAQNITQKRFERELIRLDEIPHAWILLEFTMKEVMGYPQTSTIPRKRWRYLAFGGAFILKKTIEMMIQHKVHIVFCGTHGKEVATQIMKRVLECQS